MGIVKKFVKYLVMISQIIICAVLIPVIVMNITIAVKSYISPNVVADFFGIKPFIVVSGSMEPTILTNDLIVTRTVKPELIKIGDIISFRIGASVVTHRVVDLQIFDDYSQFITKGDWENASIDQSPVLFNQVEGLYLFRVGGFGGLALFMQTPLGIFIFIGIPIVIFMLYNTLKRRLENVQLQKKKHEELEELKKQLSELRGSLHREK